MGSQTTLGDCWVSLRAEFKGEMLGGYEYWSGFQEKSEDASMAVWPLQGLGIEKRKVSTRKGFHAVAVVVGDVMSVSLYLSVSCGTDCVALSKT